MLGTIFWNRENVRGTANTTTAFLSRAALNELHHALPTQTTPAGNPLPDSKGSTFFTYDRIFDERSSTQEVYDGVARGLVNSVIRGLNSTIFAYGQTSSGKTFTMQGGDNTYDNPGIVQMAARDLFSRMEETRDRVFLMRASYLEIYQEDIRDLLAPDPTVSKLQVGVWTFGDIA